MTTQTREETARAFAEAVGWELSIHEMPSRVTVFGGVPFTFALILPAPDAPLHEHLAFVGRIAEALGTGVQMGYCPKSRAAWVGLDERVRSSEAPDPSHAAMLAAIEARKGR